MKCADGTMTRRGFLRGMGALVSLPWLEALAPKRAFANPEPIRRSVFVYVPNGVYMPGWTPGADGKFPYTLEPLVNLQDQLLVLSGLAHRHGYANGDGPGGDHARASSVFLTGQHVIRTEGENFRVGVSVDQLMASVIGNRTVLPSLEIGCDEGPKEGHCDPGYNCVYSKTLSWASETLPVPKKIYPSDIFNKLFGDIFAPGEGQFARNAAYKTSLLDHIKEDARRLQTKVSSRDSKRIDQYLDSVRSIEARIHQTDQPTKSRRAVNVPAETPADFGEYVRLMYDLLALALESDRTRVATFYVDTEASNRAYTSIGIAEGHHELSHFGESEDKKNKIQRINRFHTEYFSEFLQKLAAVKEEDGRSLLDHCMIVYGSGISDSDRHHHNNLPILLAGGGCGTIRSGRHIQYPDNTPLTNLYVSMLERMGLANKTFGDSTEALRFLDG